MLKPHYKHALALVTLQENRAWTRQQAIVKYFMSHEYTYMSMEESVDQDLCVCSGIAETLGPAFCR